MAAAPRQTCQHRFVEQPQAAPARPGRFLLAMIDGGGTVPPALGLAQRLVGRGHQVRVLADPTVAADAESAGCSFTPWQEAPHFRTREEQTAVIAAFEGRRPVRAIKAVRGFLGPGMTGRYANDVVVAAEEFGADAVLAEGVLPGIVIGALATGLPTAALMANIYLPPTTGFPLMGTGWLPARGRLGRVRDRLAPAAARWLLARTLPRLNAVLADHGQPALQEFSELLDRCGRVLVMTSPSFDFAVPQLPGNVRFVGPQLDDPGWAAELPWQRLGNEPLVLVATSSIYQHQTDLLRRIAQALGTLPVRGVVTTGRAVDPEGIPAPPNVDVLQAAPHRRLLAEASVVVTHAGHGTVVKTLAAGVPLVCMPMGRDQKDNTVRVQRLGAGVRIRQSSTPEQIAAAIKDVLNDARYASAARIFAQILAAEAANTPSAADEAEALLGRRRPA
jgi:MGT family glycosyltransferase